MKKKTYHINTITPEPISSTIGAEKIGTWNVYKEDL